MWKDEQFGLTFLAVLNKLGGPAGRPMISRGDFQDNPQEARFSPCGVIFIHVYCLAGAFAVYDFNLTLALVVKGKLHLLRAIQLAFNEFVPFIVCNMVLALTSAVVRMPKLAPYRQLFLGMRFVALLLLLNSCSTFIDLITHGTVKYVILSKAMA